MRLRAVSPKSPHYCLVSVSFLLTTSANLSRSIARTSQGLSLASHLGAFCVTVAAAWSGFATFPRARLEAPSLALLSSQIRTSSEVTRANFWLPASFLLPSHWILDIDV